MIAQLRHFARRFVLMLSGEVMQSIFHFAFNVALVRALPAHDYGVFATVLLMGGLALQYVRCLVGTPACLAISPALGRRSALALDVTFGSGALALSLGIGAGTALCLHVWLGSSALTGGAYIGLWSMRAYLRTAFFARHQQGYASLSDLVFTLSGTILALTLLLGPQDDLLDRSFLVLALANALSIAAALLFPLRRIRLNFGRATRARFTRLMRQLSWSLLGVTMGNLQAQGQIMLVIMLAGPVAYAPIAAMQVFFAPLRLLGFAMANMMQPEIATLLARRDGAKFRELLPFWTLVMLAVSAAYGVAALLALPLISAPVFEGQPKLLLWLFAWLGATLPMLYIMPKLTLEVNRSFRLLAIIGGISAVVGMGLGAILLLLATPVISLSGILVGEAIVLVCCWYLMGTVDTRYQTTVPVPVARLGGVGP